MTTFPFVACALRAIFKKALPDSGLERSSPMFSPKNMIVLHLCLQSIFELIFCVSHEVLST